MYAYSSIYTTGFDLVIDSEWCVIVKRVSGHREIKNGRWLWRQFLEGQVQHQGTRPVAANSQCWSAYEADSAAECKDLEGSKRDNARMCVGVHKLCDKWSFREVQKGEEKDSEWWWHLLGIGYARIWWLCCTNEKVLAQI